MKILFYSSYFYPYISGLTIYPMRVLEELQKKHKITVLTFRHTDSLPEKETYHGIIIKRLKYNFKISKGFISLQSIFYFVRGALENDIIVINVPNFEALSLAIVGKLLGKKIIVIFCCEVFLGKEIISRIIVFFLNTSVFFQLLLSDYIVAFPDYIESLYVYRLFKRKIITSLPIIHKKPVDRAALKRFKKSKGEEKWIGFVGRLAREKGIEYFINAAEIIRREGEIIRLVFVGPGKNEVVGENNYANKIEEKLKQKNISYNFLGTLTDHELGAFYKSIDVLVLPSVNRTEAFGMVQAEAMLLGTPVVASDMPGVRIPIELTGMGKLINPIDAKSFAKAIEETVWNDRYRMKNLVLKARKEFGKNKVFRLYERILSS